MKKMARLLVLALAGFPAAAFAAGGGKILHEPVSCVPAQGHGRVEATLAPGVTASSVRVYFRADGAKSEYYAEMRRNQPGRYWAVLPVVAPGQQAVVYRVVARETEGEFARTPNLGTVGTVGPGTVGTTAAPGRPSPGQAGGLVIGGTQGTTAGVNGQPISSARPPR